MVYPREDSCTLRTPTPKIQKKTKKPARKKKCQVFPPGAAPAEGNCVELASGGLAGATLSREIDL